MGRQGETISPQGFQTQLGRTVEGVEVEGLIDVLVLCFGLTVGCAVVPWVIQGVDLTVFTPGDKRVLFNRIQVFCSTDQKREGGRIGVQREGEKDKIQRSEKIYEEKRNQMKYEFKEAKRNRSMANEERGWEMITAIMGAAQDQTGVLPTNLWHWKSNLRG